MTTICAQQLKHCPSQSHHMKPLEIPPRKLFTKKSHHEGFDTMSSFHSNLHNYLPCNDCSCDNFDKDANDQLDPYSSDHFRMYEFKVRRCTRSRSHDWTDCPFAHPGEKARRRDPRRYHYSGTVCPQFRRGTCSRGENCEFSHGVFECWLHPSRYRTEACKDGKNCNRKVCFFAHSPRQLRILPEVSRGTRKYDKTLSPCSSFNHAHCCCLVCHSLASSPTSTLMGMSHMSPPMSPSLSPPLSPVKHRSFSGLSTISRYSDRVSKLGSRVINYEDVLNELVTSLEAMNFSEAASSPVSLSANNRTNFNIPWINDSSLTGDHQQQLILTPATTTADHCGSGKLFKGNCSNRALIEDPMASSDLDLGWVNELLM
ncbi:hypothetical protein K2173_018838 [Erythroxylum novogranatense]|uniref:C3H1-type domain-containing protein n=1 Tax=Erythroxylum novogranatense TaxID=1862640 RepID=A0AAV8SAZ8_9ROSI|nr:hypothetical protein K2173_018838 [Erythroxylum novogranatense]